MSFIMVLHSLIGTTVVCAGGLALLSHKGSALHRLSGLAFTGALILMGLVVAAGARFESGSISALGILFVVFMLYLVVTAWSTMRQPAQRLGPLDYAAPVVALFISISGLMLGIEAFGNSGAQENLPPEEAYFLFAALALIAMILDVNHLRSGGVRGKHRYIKHIWRMSGALFFAASSLFTGPGSVVFPDSLRESPALSIPQYLVVGLSLFGIYKVWFKAWRPHSTKRRSYLESQDSAITQTTRKPQ